MWLSINEDVTVNLLGAKNIFVDGERKQISASFFSGSPDSSCIHKFKKEGNAEKFFKILAVKLKNASLFPDSDRWLELKTGCLVNLPQVLCFYVQAADSGFEFKAQYTDGKEFCYKIFETQAEAREALRKVTIKIGGWFINEEVLNNEGDTDKVSR